MTQNGIIMLWIIPIIRDTLGEGGVQYYITLSFYRFLNCDLNADENLKKSCLGVRIGFFSFYNTIQSRMSKIT